MPPRIDPNHPFARAVAAALKRRCAVRAGARVLLAVSGGADSVALTLAVAGLAPRRGWGLQPAVAHVRHRLRRDGSAEADAAFTASLAASLDLPYLEATLDDPPAGVNIEAWARHARYDALAVMARAFDAPTIATAHQADDQLETLMMRLLRGSSLRGLSGMAWRRRITASGDPVLDDADAAGGEPLRLIRPMLGVTREDARAFLRDHHQDWREDPTNADTSRLRARLRAAVLPALAEVDPHIAARATAAADHLRQAARLVETAICAAADRVRLREGVAVIDRMEARTMPSLVLSGLVRRLALEAGAAPDRLGRRAVTPIVRAARDREGGVRGFMLDAGVAVTIDAQTVRVGRSA